MPLAYAVESVGFVPPPLLFVVVAAYNVFGLMSGFANGEDRRIPRRARVPLCFGAARLIIAFVINVRTATTGELDRSFQGWMNNLFLLSLFFLGLPYLGWIVWKRRERLVAVPALTGTLSAAIPRDPR